MKWGQGCGALSAPLEASFFILRQMSRSFTVPIGTSIPTNPSRFHSNRPDKLLHPAIETRTLDPGLFRKSAAAIKPLRETSQRALLPLPMSARMRTVPTSGDAARSERHSSNPIRADTFYDRCAGRRRRNRTARLEHGDLSQLGRQLSSKSRTSSARLLLFRARCPPLRRGSSR